MAQDTPWRTFLNGRQITLPSTINDIRAALPPERRGEFDVQVGTAPAEELLLLLAHRAQETRPDLRAEQDRLVARLEAGDSSGFFPAEDI